MSDNTNTSPGGYDQTYGAYSNKHQSELIRLFLDCYEEIGGCDVCPVAEKCVAWWHSRVCNCETKQITKKEHDKLAEEFKVIKLQALQGSFLILLGIRQQQFEKRQEQWMQKISATA